MWLDRATGEVRTDETDEPWAAFVERMIQVHGFTAELIRNDVSDSAIVGELQPDTFVCTFKRSLARSPSP